MSRLSHLDALEAEAIHILREGVAEGRNPVMLFSAGKDSTVLAHLAVLEERMGDHVGDGVFQKRDREKCHDFFHRKHFGVGKAMCP